MNHIINIRGTNGAGKTTLVRALMSKFEHLKDYTTKNGVFVHIYMTEAEQYVSFVGKYDASATGGVDRVKNVRDVVEACAELSPYSHIVLEGLIMSGLQQLTKDIADACASNAIFHAYTLDSSKEKCIEQTLRRRQIAGNTKPFDPAKSLLPKYRAVELAAIKLKSWGINSSVMSQKDILNQVCGLLNVECTGKEL
jgi:hypothetical protein